MNRDTLKPRVLCFGEVLWDCLPHARLLGGAPLNVAFHAGRLGAETAIISSVGRDALGDEALAKVRAYGLSAAWIARHDLWPTGTAQVALNTSGQPDFAITEPAAWDEIAITTATLVEAARCAAIIFGTLAARSASNQLSLERLLAVNGPLKVLDVNLRAPFDDKGRALSFAGRADVIKLNADELSRLSGRRCHSRPSVEEGVAALHSRVGEKTLCVTLGADGAALYHQGRWFHSDTPHVRVVDTIGAGDAFTAALVLGLLAQEPPERLLERACQLGSLVASLPGAQPDYDPEPLRMCFDQSATGGDNGLL